MEIDTSGVFSTDKVYGYPFQTPKVTINAHTPYDEKEDDEGAVTLKDFRGGKQNFKYEKTDDEAVKNEAYGIDNGYKPPKVEYGKEPPEFPPKSVKGFSASQISSDAIVKKAIGNGFSYEEAITAKKTQEAYGLTKNPIGRLGDRNFEVNQ